MPARKTAEAKAPAAPLFFASPAEFGAWLAAHGGRETALIVGFHKRATNRPSMTWPEAVDEALCHGWIDGVRTRIDEQRYKIRFTPRKPTSIWSAINIGRVAALSAEGRMTPAGERAFGRRSEAKSRIYAYEQTEVAALSDDELARFRDEKAAWGFFEAQPPGYRRQMIWRVVSAKRADTRERRLGLLIEASRGGLRL